MKTDRAVVIPVAAAATTALIGLTRASDEPFWLDEAVTALVIRRPFSGLIDVLFTQEAGMTSYYIALWSWAQFIPGDLGLRLFSVLGAAVATLVVVRITQRWFTTTAAIVAACLMVTHPFVLRYSTEVRAYSWVLALSALSLDLLDRALRRNEMQYYVYAGFIAGLGIASHLLFAIQVGLMCFATSFSATKISLRHWTAYLGVTGTLGLLTLPSAISRTSQLDWLGPQSSNVYRAQLLDFAGTWHGNLLAFGVMASALALRDVELRSWPAVTCLTVGVLYVLAVFILSFAKYLFLSRYLAPALPALVISAAGGFDWLTQNRYAVRWRPLPIAAVCAIIVGAFVMNRPFDDRSRGDGVAAAVSYMTNELRPGDLVVVEHQRAVVQHFLGYRPEIDLAVLPSSDAQLEIAVRPLTEYLADLQNAPTIYLIYWSGWPVEPEMRALIAERTVAAVRDFGDTSVWTLK